MAFINPADLIVVAVWNALAGPAVDSRWEGHSRGHGSCGECLRAHNSCVEACERIEQYMTCQFDGLRPDGRRVPITGSGWDRRQAERDAENRCYAQGFRRCNYARCDRVQDRNIVSRRDCRGRR